MNIDTSSFYIFRSSAGSGKTYQLALEFVSLAIKNPNLFNKILAVTFTNKATKEMKERILSFLQILSVQADADLVGRVKEITGLSGEQVAENAAIVNEKILHNYSEFSISTIDAFFQKVVKSFAKELGLLGNYKVELDQDKVMQEIIDQIIAELGKEKTLTNWLVDFSFSKVDEHKAWNIRPEIESLAGEVLKESFRKVEAELRSGQVMKFDVLMRTVKKARKDFEHYMKSKAKEALKLIETHGLQVDDFSRKSSGPAGYFSRIIKKSDYDPKKLVPEACADPGKWSTKTSPKKEEIQTIVEEGLQEITKSLVEHYQNHSTEYNTAIEIQKNLYVFGILSRIMEKLNVYRQEHDVMLISDVAVFLNKIIADNDTPFIYEKTGSWYRHFLIDEFQDTSGYQWKNFKPLVETGLSEHHKCLLVGDGKQSIYRWRGGDWSLISHQVEDELKNYQPEIIPLDTNWRSDRKIIEFNNEVFSFLRTLVRDELQAEIEDLSLAETEKVELLTKTESVKNLFQDVIQKISEKNKLPSNGVVQINAYESIEGESWKDSVLADLPKTLEKLQDQGFAARDIAILVRKGDDGKKVIEQILRYKYSDEAQSGYCYDAISNESLYLGNSSAIRLIINTMKYGLNPKDDIARAEIRFIYHSLKGVREKNLSSDLSFLQDEASLPPQINESIQTLVGLPVYELVERIIQLFDLTSSEFKGYIQAFQDLILEYFSGEHRDIVDFLEWWEDKGKRKSVQLPENMNAVRVMTIHKSKGLEFKALIIPFCDWKLDHDANKNIIWCKTERKPFDIAGYLPLKYSKALAESYFAQEYYEEKIKAHIDNLNLLYVALTRAEKYLIINCPPKSRDKLSSAGDLMLNSIEKIELKSRYNLKVHVDEESENITRYVIGAGTAVEVDEQSNELEEVSVPYQSSDWRERITIRKRGADYFSVDGSEQKAKINYGILVHEILASSKNQEEAELCINSYFSEGVINSQEKGTISDQLNGIFSNPEVSRWFNTSAEVKTEVPIITQSGQERRPDRVLIEELKVVIIDFKTGMEKSSDKRQALEYRSIFLEMGYTQVDAYLLYIAENRVLKVG